MEYLRTRCRWVGFFSLAVDLLLTLVFCFIVASPVLAEQQRERYEYKILPLGSLTPLQKDAKKSKGKTQEIEGILNGEGKEGWEMVSIFAVRTTFDPNTFFVILKRKN